ncbi:hypothetical protein M0805_005117 [Coniferiporia weirii]|nr:hypothetical protein M0805_005117 [Coniferiporia weirii]
MPSVDTYDTTVTSVEFSWPKGVTPLERIMLSAHGDLQRILSAFFARPITINRIFAQTVPSSMSLALAPSPASPAVQKRQVHLVCNGRTVCVATSSVTITSPRCAQLFLQEGYAIGQIFRKMGVVPTFELLEAGLVDDLDDADNADTFEKLGNGSRREKKIWRRYTLKTEGFFADIVEVFPDRGMFTRGEEWLTEPPMLSIPVDDTDASSTPGLSPTDTLVHHDDVFESRVRSVSTKETWTDSSGGLLRFMAVFIAVLLLLAVPRDGDANPQTAGSLFARVARLLDVHGVSEES